MKVTFIGLGIMGSRMAANLISEEVKLTVYNRDVGKAEALAAKGAEVAHTLPSAVEEADIVFTMLSTPRVVRDSSSSDQGFLQHMPKGALWVDCSTVAPADVEINAVNAKEAGIQYLEAPVAGTKQPAENGELVFFVGGEESNLTTVSPLLDRMGKKTIFMGMHGAAASIKLLVNLMLAQSMLAFSEAVKLGDVIGLSKEKVMNILLNVPVTAPFLQNLRGKLDSGDTSPNFPMQWMLKDLGLVHGTADSHDLRLPSALTAEDIFRSALDSGMEDQDFSSVFHFINQ